MQNSITLVKGTSKIIYANSYYIPMCNKRYYNKNARLSNSTSIIQYCIYRIIIIQLFNNSHICNKIENSKKNSRLSDSTSTV